MNVSNQINDGEPEFQVEGNLVYSAERRGRSGAGKIKHSRSFLVARKGGQWKIRTTNLKEDHLSDGLDYDEMGCDGTKIFDLKSFDRNHPNISIVKDIISAQGRVRQDEAPRGLDDAFIYPLWLAYCSANYLLSREGNRVAAPDFLVGDSLTAAAPPVLLLPAEWKLNESNFVSAIAWQSEGKELAWKDGSSEYITLPPPFDAGYLRASFETTDWIEFTGLHLPNAFVVKEFFPNWETNKCDVSYTVEAQARAVGPLRTFSFLPELTKKTLITDTRYRLSPGCGHVSYGSSNWMSEEEVEAKCKGMGIEYEKQTAQN